MNDEVDVSFYGIQKQKAVPVGAAFCIYCIVVLYISFVVIVLMIAFALTRKWMYQQAPKWKYYVMGVLATALIGFASFVLYVLSNMHY